MSRYKFTSDDCSKGGKAVSDGGEKHWERSCNGWAELCARHGKPAALGIIKGKQKKRGIPWERRTVGQ